MTERERRAGLRGSEGDAGFFEDTEQWVIQ